MKARLILKDGTIYEGESFGAPVSTAGEVVFATGMTGYPESLTDPSYKGQIVTFTYPLIGNYGVPDPSHWESSRIMVSGLIVSNYIDTPSHFQSKRTLAQWFKDENLPLVEIKDTRLITQKIRSSGTILGKIIIEKDIDFYNPNIHNLIDQVSTKEIHTFPSPGKTTVLIDCGAKRNIQKNLSRRGVDVIVVPWNTDIFEDKFPRFDALVISNGPGDPKMAATTIATVKKALDNKIPTLGICLGHQILSLAAGGDTRKLKYGHRSQNQPCIIEGTDRCIITTQNHGFEVSKIPPGFKPWFTNANDNSNEGIKHEKLPFMSTQFHPEANPGPKDAEWIFDYFLERVK
ncbi:MAG: glutamine-hydrolyzing carbamoyl-phosphate synthase small subunit [Candidatus Margulisiibacteriota bacterium]